MNFIKSVILVALLALPNSETERVVRVIDGDTIDVLDDAFQKTRIRFHGIDAPENGQPYFQKSKEFLASLVAGKDVSIKHISFDRNKRRVGVVSLPGDADLTINAQIVKAGFAWVDQRFTSDSTLLALQSKARKDKLGLWADPSPMPPWEFRKLKKENKTN